MKIINARRNIFWAAFLCGAVFLPALFLMAGSGARDAGDANASSAGQKLLLSAGGPVRSVSDLQARDIYGRKTSFVARNDSSFTIVTFFATCCCIYCAQELRELRAMQVRNPSFRFILISLDTWMGPNVTAFVKRSGLEAPIIYDGDGRFYNAFGMEQLPHSFVVNRDGQILAEGKRFGEEGLRVSSWESPQVLAFLRRMK